MGLSELISKEVMITCGLFLFAFIIGIHLFKSLGVGDSSALITSAAVIDAPDASPNHVAPQGATVKHGKKGIFGVLSDEDAYDKKSLKELQDQMKNNLKNNPTKNLAGNLITGNVIGTILQDSSDIVQIGTYTESPSFVIENPTHGSVDALPEKLQEQAALFSQRVAACRVTKGADTKFLSLCIQQTLQETPFQSWFSDEKCETAEEQVFYDFTERLSSCAGSLQDNCACSFSLDYKRGYGAGRYLITLLNGEEGMYLTLDSVSSDSKSLTAALEDYHFNAPTLVVQDTAPDLLYNILYKDQVVASLYFGVKRVDEISTLSLVDDTPRSLAFEGESAVYIHKHGGTLTFLDAAAFKQRQGTVASCQQKDLTAHKFCFKEDDFVRVFALEFG